MNLFFYLNNIPINFYTNIFKKQWHSSFTIKTAKALTKEEVESSSPNSRDHQPVTIKVKIDSTKAMIIRMIMTMIRILIIQVDLIIELGQQEWATRGTQNWEVEWEIGNSRISSMIIILMIIRVIDQDNQIKEIMNKNMKILDNMEIIQILVSNNIVVKNHKEVGILNFLELDQIDGINQWEIGVDRCEILKAGDQRVVLEIQVNQVKIKIIQKKRLKIEVNQLVSMVSKLIILEIFVLLFNLWA